MQDTMRRFLKSIGIEDAERFDIDFDLASRDPFNAKRWLFNICKDTPWVPSLLNEFQDGLTGIDYDYRIQFSYKSAPSIYNAIDLWQSWYFRLHRATPTVKIEAANPAEIAFSFLAEEEERTYAPAIADFQSFLDWLNYPFRVSSSLSLSEKAPEISKSKMNKLEKEANKETKKAFKAEENNAKTLDADLDYEIRKSKIEEPIVEEAPEPIEQKENTLEKEIRAAQEAFLEQERARKAAELREAEMRRVRRKGNYHALEGIKDIENAPLENIEIEGYVFEADSRTTRTGKLVYTFSIHDDESAISCRAFADKTALTPEVMKDVKPGAHLKILGAIDVDMLHSNERQIRVHFIENLPPKALRDDPEPEKRVELHLHTKMSVMDGTGDIEEYIKLAKHMGMKAIAVTDHGCVQDFPHAQDTAKKAGMKMIYGCEFYMFDAYQRNIFNPQDKELLTATYCVFDLETTGLSSRLDRITEFGGVIVRNGLIIDRLDLFINPGVKIPEAIVRKTRITDEMVKDAPTIEEAMPKIMDFIKDYILVSHNATFDVGYLNAARKRMGLEPLKNGVVDTLALSRYLFPEAAYHNLGTLSKNLGLTSYNTEEAHRADFDAEALNDVWQAILPRLTKDAPNLKHSELGALQSDNPNIYKHMRTYHVVALARNEDGLHDLYRLVTDSNLEYLAQVPKITRQRIQELRKNLIIGSACVNGEIFEIAQTRGEDELIEAMRFYDYIELQPLENYSNLFYEGSVNDKGRIVDICKIIYEAAKKAGKMVVATGDCHYVNPEDKITRDVYIQAKAVGNARHPLNPYWRDLDKNKAPEKQTPLSRRDYPNPDMHFRSTKEMLDCFMEWLPEEEAREIVVKNSNIIADQCGEMYPVSDDLFTPDANLPHSAEMIRELCYKNFNAKYDKAPPEVKERLDRELDGIIGNGYSVTYYIAQQIIKKANEDGYIVGSRGSVGSSFAANMADITEVNALPPHYWCPKCHHFEWGNDPKIRSGFDLPDKRCPECGESMQGDGQNIPFETFLGFNADKVPDIDLNFPPDYQAKAHDYMRTLLGKDSVFRAGTIEKVATKTAYGYVRGYWEWKGLDPDSVNRNWTAYIASRCEGVKRTTGQHPGGIVVVPADRSVYDFTPIQHPADKQDADWLTTHFDFRSMHDELLKIDLLGHVDPLATRLMSQLTGIDLLKIPMNDKKVLSLFHSPKALNVDDDDYLQMDTGTLGMPEFGTDMAQRMLTTAKPKTFNDLLAISGLAHGTDVWANNAETLITNHITDINGVIGCRDDIMTYLISKGVPSGTAFQIMERVRKGDGPKGKLKQEWLDLMKAKGVPQYYIDSCKKIAYLFPRAHATAYVMMACRVGYFKIYYPLEFYAVFFSVRSDDWDIKTMIAGKNAIVHKLEDFKRRSLNRDHPLDNKEKNIEASLRIACEMVERGYKFENIDLYKSAAAMFVCDHENKALIPPFNVIDGLGLAAANTIVEARKQGKFLSKEDLLRRTKLSKTHVEALSQMGVLDGLGETNQMSLFEFML